MFVITLFTFLLVAGISAVKGPCFSFNGHAHLEFEPENFDISRYANYKMQFRTVKENGILLYARGTHDYEALYIFSGKLHYIIVNPTSWGAGGTSGDYFQSNDVVNNNTYFTVEIFRNRIKHKRARLAGNPPLVQTGMILKAEGTEKHIHNKELEGLQIIKPVYIGGDGKNSDAVIQEFEGEIRDIHEKRNDFTFEYPSRNSGVSRCFDLVHPTPAHVLHNIQQSAVSNVKIRVLK